MTIHNDFLVGGGDGDALYGDGGIDTFDFDAIGTVDDVHFFNEGDGDVLDLRDIVSFSGGAITDYVQLTDTGDHQMLAVDADGVGGFTNVAELLGQQDLDVATLYANGQILV